MRRRKKSANYDVNNGENSSKSIVQINGKCKQRSRDLSNERAMGGSCNMPRRHISNNVMDDSDSEEEYGDFSQGASAMSSGVSKGGRGAYHNLETFQKKQLKQKASNSVFIKNIGYST